VRGKIAVKTRDDLSMAYTPGVARVCMAMHQDPEKAYALTIKQNCVAVVTDGTAVLGLGDIGPNGAQPVMEGKALIFREFAGVDAFPLCLATKDVDEIVTIVKAISPVFGGINLEDISAPRCFEIEERLQRDLEIPVFHDNQHGTAVVVLAALLNAMLAVIVIGIASLPAAFNVVMAWKSITPPAKQPLSDSAKSSLVGLAIIAAIIAGFILLATNVTP